MFVFTCIVFLSRIKKKSFLKLPICLGGKKQKIMSQKSAGIFEFQEKMSNIGIKIKLIVLFRIKSKVYNTFENCWFLLLK